MSAGATDQAPSALTGAAGKVFRRGASAGRIWLKALVLGIWLWLPTLSVVGTDQVQGASAVLALLLFSAAALVFPLIFIARVRLYFLLCTPLALLAPVYCYLTLLYGSVPGDALVDSALHTSLATSWQVILSFGWLVALVPLSLGIYLLAAWRLPWSCLVPVEWRKRLAALLLMVLMLAMTARQVVSHALRLPPLLDQSTLSLAFPSSLISSLSRVALRDQDGGQFGTVHGRPAGVAEPLLVVLVIGESVRSDHLGINGYARNTTSQLVALGAELLSFPDVTSRANWTNAAVPGILAFPLTSLGDEGPRASLMQSFREAGFRTAWLGNQEPFTVGAGAEVVEYATNTRDYHFRKDVDLLPQFSSFMRQAGQRQFVILHMMGSHIPYEERYDAASRVFTPTMQDLGVTAPQPSDRTAVINSYDNTIVELDRFLGRTIALLRTEKRPAVLVYTSDHGENLLDDGRKLFMHAQPGPTRYDTHVPLLVWTNTAYRTKYPAVVSALQTNLRRRIGHADMFATLLQLGEVAWDGSDPHRSVASMQYAEAPRMVKMSLAGKELEAGSLR